MGVHHRLCPPVPLRHGLLLDTNEEHQEDQVKTYPALGCLAPLPGRVEPDSEPDSRFPRPVSSKPPSAQPASAPQKLLRTPTGWTSMPEAYQLPATAQYGLPQLPFPQFSPVVYYGRHQPFSQCGFPGSPGCGRDPQYPQCRQESLPYPSWALTTLLSAGAQGLVKPSERLPIWFPMSLWSGTTLPVLNPVQGRAEPPTQTLSSPQSPSTSRKKRLTLSEEEVDVVGRQEERERSPARTGVFSE